MSNTELAHHGDVTTSTFHGSVVAEDGPMMDPRWLRADKMSAHDHSFADTSDEEWLTPSEIIRQTHDLSQWYVAETPLGPQVFGVVPEKLRTRRSGRHIPMEAELAFQFAREAGYYSALSSAAQGGMIPRESAIRQAGGVDPSEALENLYDLRQQSSDSRIKRKIRHAYLPFVPEADGGGSGKNNSFQGWGGMIATVAFHDAGKRLGKDNQGRRFQRLGKVAYYSVSGFTMGSLVLSACQPIPPDGGAMVSPTETQFQEPPSSLPEFYFQTALGDRPEAASLVGFPFGNLEADLAGLSPEAQSETPLMDPLFIAMRNYMQDRPGQYDLAGETGTFWHMSNERDFDLNIVLVETKRDSAGVTAEFLVAYQSPDNPQEILVREAEWNGQEQTEGGTLGTLRVRLPEANSRRLMIAISGQEWTVVNPSDPRPLGEKKALVIEFDNKPTGVDQFLEAILNLGAQQVRAEEPEELPSEIPAPAAPEQLASATPIPSETPEPSATPPPAEAAPTSCKDIQAIQPIADRFLQEKGYTNWEQAIAAAGITSMDQIKTLYAKNTTAFRQAILLDNYDITVSILGFEGKAQCVIFAVPTSLTEVRLLPVIVSVTKNDGTESGSMIFDDVTRNLIFSPGDVTTWINNHKGEAVEVGVLVFGTSVHDFTLRINLPGVDRSILNPFFGYAIRVGATRSDPWSLIEQIISDEPGLMLDSISGDPDF